MLLAKLRGTQNDPSVASTINSARTKNPSGVVIERTKSLPLLFVAGFFGAGIRWMLSAPLFDRDQNLGDGFATRL